jgi:methionyl-tRNA formyltransferase
LRILASIDVDRPEEFSEAALAGTIDRLAVRCGDGRLLRLETVQPEGRSAMDVQSWANGARAAVGEVLGA